MTLSSESSSDPAQIGLSDWLIGGGTMGQCIRSMDWSQTPLGPITHWPPSLRTTVSLVINSNFPISLAWGPQHIQIYNDGYWPICGDKHPQALGQDFTECWASAWPAIGTAFASALAGTTAFLEDQRMFLDRHGYLEETFFTFSFSPIYDQDGQVAGLFHPVTETTSKMIGERRTRTLRDLATYSFLAQSLEDGQHQAAQSLASSELDVPFVLFYQLDQHGQTAQLVAQAGLLPGSEASPASVDLAQVSRGWPIAEVAATNRQQLLGDLSSRFGDLICGPYPEPITSAFVQAITPPGQTRPVCIMVTGVSTRVPLNEAYIAFYDLLAAAVTTVIANAIAHQAERQRTEALAAIDRAKTAFFSNVSHEFRTPLTLLLGPLEDELAEQELPPAQRARLEIAHRNSLRLLKLVNSLLDFVRIETGRVQAVYQPTDLAALTIGLAANFRSACEQAGLQLHVNCPALPAPVYVDQEMWEKIVLNLLSNAFKFTFVGAITISLIPVGEAVELSVHDTGVGISADELPQIFDRFHRVKGSYGRTYEGTGIGLALVQELAALHGGAIQASSMLGQGSTFTVVIPLGNSHLPPEQLGSEVAHTATAAGARPFVEEALRWLSSPNTGSALTEDTINSHDSQHTIDPSASSGVPAQRARIVWADDNSDMRDYVQRLLQDDYNVEAVKDGAAALAAVRRQPADLVLTDVMMPRLDGFSLLHELRADQRTRSIPVILLSARAGDEARIEGLESGADDYLVKPFSARELLARIGTQIELARLRHAWAAELEQQVAERTAALVQITQDLRIEIRERKHAEQALQHNADRLRVLADASRTFAEIGADYQALLEQIVRMLTALLGQGCSIFLLSEHANTMQQLHLAAQYDLEPAQSEQIRSTFDQYPIQASALSLARRIIQTRQPLLIPIVDQEQIGTFMIPQYQTLIQRLAIHSVIAVPMRVQGQTLGALIVYRYRDGQQPFDQSDLNLAQDLADRAALAIDSARLFQQVQYELAERQKAESAVRLLNEELEQRVSLRTAELSAAYKELEAFSYSISHDLRSPLRAISGFTRILLEDYAANLPYDAQHYFQLVRENAQRMGYLIDDLLAFSRLSRQPLTKRVVNPTELVRQCLDELDSEHHERAIEIHRRDLPACLADPALLKQVWLNLLANAFKYTRRRDPAVIELNFYIQDTETIYSVKDNGVGFDMSYSDKLFGVFQRLHRAEDYEGTGVGLAIVHRIIQRHGGRIWAEAAIEQGATFYFTLGAE